MLVLPLALLITCKWRWEPIAQEATAELDRVRRSP